ncbi:MAG: arginine--tRNA ligase [Acidobacteriota bacterium]|nr:MAG: arginine--tRNA ligase [Acidobacteriota bacterium]
MALTLLQIQTSLREKLASLSNDLFGVVPDIVAVETPPKTEFGDLAFPIAFELAKKIKQATGEKKNPREIAQTLKEEIEKEDLVQKVDVAGAGYLNIFVDRALFLPQNSGAAVVGGLTSASPDAPKVCVEHTSVNPNKAAHIGHVRNSVLGDTFQRILGSTGKRVEVQNYIDNTGVQVADVVVGFIYLENMGLDEIKALDENLKAEGRSFDYYCWDLYARVGQEYQVNDALKSKRAEVLHAIEEGGNQTAELADYVATRNVECIIATMERLGIRYDLLPRESEILHLHFWDRAFEQMKQLGVIRYESEGNHVGCWVMPFDSHEGTDDHENDKILVRSNGTVTYTGKDIAYQMWKLGILGLDFNYRLFHTYPDGKDVWITTGPQAASLHESNVPSFGGGETIYNVIDTRQSYPQEVVKKGVAAISPERGEKASVHLSYEMVALSPAAAVELGFELSEDDRKRTFIEMSGRKGLGVKADDLIDRLEEKAIAEVESRHADAADDEKRHIGRQIAVGALRYFLLKFTRTTVIVFDFAEALSFEGETGCFCQYSAVRANSIFRKFAETGGKMEGVASAIQDVDALREVFSADDGDDIWSLAVLAARIEDAARQSAAANEPSILAKYAFNLAKAFNLFYHRHKILSEADETKRAVLLTVTDMARISLTRSLELLGIDVPERM